MSISPTHWMPIRGPRCTGQHHAADDVTSFPRSPLDESLGHTQTQRRCHHHLSSQRRQSNINCSSDRNERHHHQLSHRHYHAPNHAIRKVAPPPPPPHIFHQQSNQEGEGSNNNYSRSRISPSLQPYLGYNYTHNVSNNDSMILNSASQSRSSSVTSCLSSAYSEDSSLFPCDFHNNVGELHGNTPHVQSYRLSSEVLAELALKGTGVSPQHVEDDDWTREEHDTVAELPTPTVSTTSPFPFPPPPPPPPPPLPASAVHQPLATTNSDGSNSGCRRARQTTEVQDNSYGDMNGGVKCGSGIAEGTGVAQAKKPQPRVTTNMLPPCGTLFKHMEGSPHGIQLLASRSPRLVRRRNSQQQQYLATALPSLTAQMPPLPDAEISNNNSNNSESVEAGRKADGSGGPPLSPAGSSNGLSARTPGGVSTSAFLAGSSGGSANAGVSFVSPTTENAPMATPKMFYQATPTFATEGPHPPGNPSRSGRLLSPLLPLGGCGSATPRTSMTTPESCRDALSIPPSPATRVVKPGGVPPPKFSVPSDSGSSSTISGAAMKIRPPSLNLSGPRPASPRRLSSSYMSPLTDHHRGEGSMMLISLPATPLEPRPSSTTPRVPPLDFSGISDGPLVRDGEAVSAGPWWRSSDEASAMLSPCVMAGPYTHSGYDEDDDESEDEFADYRPLWRKEEERRQLELELQQQQQPETSLVSTARDHRYRNKNSRKSGTHAAAEVGDEEEISSNEDYIVPGYNDTTAKNPALPSFYLDGKQNAKATRRNFPSRAAAMYANRNLHKDLSRSFLRGGGATHRSAKVGTSATSWMESVKRFLSVAGTWLARFLAIYLSSLLILKTRNKM